MSAAKSSYNSLRESFSDIVTAISVSNPLKVGDDLFTAGLISQETLDKLELPTNTDYIKSRILVMSVLNLVKLAPAKLEAFMEVLQKSISQSSYDGKFHKCLEFNFHIAKCSQKPFWGITGCAVVWVSQQLQS